MRNFTAQKMTEKNLSQRQCASMFGITSQSLQRYEAGTVLPSVEIALKIARALDCAVEDIFVLDDDEKEIVKYD